MLQKLVPIVLRRKKIVVVIILFYIFSVYIVPKLFFSSTPPFKLFISDSQLYCNAPGMVTGDEGNELPGYKLVQVQVLIRHGDRAPIDAKALPNTSPVHISCNFSKYKSTYGTMLKRFESVIQKKPFKIINSKAKGIIHESMFCQNGQLTPRGHLQHLFLAGHLKSKYTKLISNTTLHRDILMQSTDVARTIQSVATLISEMFHDQHNGKPVNIYVYGDNQKDGHLILDENYRQLNCPKLDQISKKSLEGKAWRDFRLNISPMIQEVGNILETDRVPPINRIADVLYTRLCHGQGVPRGPNNRISPRLVEQAFENAHNYVQVKHKDVAEHQSLSIFSQIAKQILDLLFVNNPKKFVFYSGHDTMISPFLVVLGIKAAKWPPYASRIVLEVYMRNDVNMDSIIKKIENTFFRVIYNGVIMKDISFCKSSSHNNTLCSLNDLFVYVTDGLYSSQFRLMTIDSFHQLLFTRIKNICV